MVAKGPSAAATARTMCNKTMENIRLVCLVGLSILTLVHTGDTTDEGWCERLFVNYGTQTGFYFTHFQGIKGSLPKHNTVGWGSKIFQNFIKLFMGGP
jgi:hypothetical protein